MTSHEWPAKWVSESATEAIGAYSGRVFGPVSLKADGKIDRMGQCHPLTTTLNNCHG